MTKHIEILLFFSHKRKHILVWPSSIRETRSSKPYPFLIQLFWLTAGWVHHASDARKYPEVWHFINHHLMSASLSLSFLKICESKLKCLIALVTLHTSNLKWIFLCFPLTKSFTLWSCQTKAERYTCNYYFSFSKVHTALRYNFKICVEMFGDS